MSRNNNKTFEFYDLMDELLNSKVAPQISSRCETNLDLTADVTSSEDETAKHLLPVEKIKEDAPGMGKKKWSSEETAFFLELCREHNIIKMMDGKRLRMKQVFSILVPILAKRGYQRDSDQLFIKWKNLKGDYYKCKRQISVSGNNSKTFEFYDLMDELLNSRPASEMSSEYETNLDLTTDITSSEDEAKNSLPVEHCFVITENYDNLLDDDGAAPSTSSSSHNTFTGNPSSLINNSNGSKTSNSNRPQKKKNKIASVLEQMTAIVADSARRDREEEKFMMKFLERQEMMLKEFSSTMLKGMQDIFKRKRESESDDE